VTRTILVVDDEPDLVANCERLLQRAGHESRRAHTGPDAIALIDRERLDLVVADLRLPGVDGLAVVRHARGRVPPIPVILITAYIPSRRGQPPASPGSTSSSPSHS
jgi:CheY-like chemotaxis protein